MLLPTNLEIDICTKYTVSDRIGRLLSRHRHIALNHAHAMAMQFIQNKDSFSLLATVNPDMIDITY